MARNRNGTGSNRRITERVDKLLDVLVQGSVPTIPEAAAAAGLAERSAYKALAQPHVKAELDKRVRERLSAHAFPKAAAVMQRLLNADSEYVQADVAKHILSVCGVRPSTDSASTAKSGSISLVINLPGAQQQQPITIDASNAHDADATKSIGYEPVIHNEDYATSEISPREPRKSSTQREGGGG